MSDAYTIHERRRTDRNGTMPRPIQVRCEDFNIVPSGYQSATERMGRKNGAAVPNRRQIRWYHVQNSHPRSPMLGPVTR